MTQKLTDENLVERRQGILSAATGVFLRYGYSRTTMGDVAEAAKMSRPALYVLFPKKDDIFAAVVEDMNDRKLAELRTAMRGMRSFERKLHHCCKEWGAHGMELMEVHPDARDLFDIARPAVQAIYEDFIRLLADLLSEGMIGTKLKASPSQLARNLAFAMRGFKDAVNNAAEMRKVIALEVDTVLAAISHWNSLTA